MKKISLRNAVMFFAFLTILACNPSSSDAKPSGKSEDPNFVVATFGGTKITNKDLEDYAKARLSNLLQEYNKQVYEEKKGSLDALINEKLVEAKASSAKKSVEEYLNSEVFSQIANPTEEEIKSTYDQAKASGQPLPDLDDKFKKDIEQYLKKQKAQIAITAFYNRLRAESDVKITLPIHRLNVDANGPSKGPKNAKVTIVEFSDFQCPYCAKAEKDVAAVLKAYPNDVRLVYRDFPLNSIHPFAQKAAEASHCADDQGKYWEMHGKMFENHTELQVEKLKAYAKDLGLNQEKFDKCLDSGEKKGVVDQGVKAAEAVSVNSTPSFFVNGRALVLGRVSIEAAIKELVDEELKMKK